ncbi:MAG: electron transport complex subunit E, partial [Bacteroidota bacterium]
MKKYIAEFLKGIVRENPTFVLVLGLCPTLAVSVSVVNGIGMGIAATFVLLGSNIIISLMRKIVPERIRIPCYIVVIATFVTINELVMKAYSPALDRALGIYVPLIVVNCIILGRAESFAAKNTPWLSVVDGAGMGVGFTFALILIGIIREILGNGSAFNISLFGPKFEPWVIMILPPGGFITLGFLLLGFSWYAQRKIN